MSLTQSVWCSIDCIYGSFWFLQFQMRMMESRPAEYSLWRYGSYCRELTDERWNFSTSSRITNDIWKPKEGRVKLDHLSICGEVFTIGSNYIQTAITTRTVWDIYTFLLGINWCFTRQCYITQISLFSYNIYNQTHPLNVHQKYLKYYTKE